MNDHTASSPAYVRYADFLHADPRRQGNALELGHDWRDGPRRYRLCWYEETGELTAERLSPGYQLELEDFHHGVHGPVEILARIPTRQELRHLLGDWPNIAPNQPRTLAWLRALARTIHAPRPA